MVLKRILTALGIAAPPSPAWSGGLYDSPLHRWLDAAGFPWRATRAELVALYGHRTDPAYRWPVISVPTPLLDGLLYPLSAHADARYPLSVPATEFAGHVSVGPDPRANLRHVEAQLLPHLGPTRVASENDTLYGRWVFGRRRA